MIDARENRSRLFGHRVRAAFVVEIWVEVLPAAQLDETVPDLLLVSHASMDMRCRTSRAKRQAFHISAGFMASRFTA